VVSWGRSRVGGVAPHPELAEAVGAARPLVNDALRTGELIPVRVEHQSAGAERLDGGGALAGGHGRAQLGVSSVTTSGPAPADPPGAGVGGFWLTALKINHRAEHDGGQEAAR